MHLTMKRVRFFTWTIILFSVVLGAGIYFWSQEKYETKAGVTMSSPTVSDNTLTTGLVGHWTFDRPDIVWSDTTSEIKDRSGNGYSFNSTNKGSGEERPGKIAQALEFVDTGYPNYLFQTESELDTLAVGSVSLWLKWDGVSTGGGTLFGHSECATPNGQFQISMDMTNYDINIWMSSPGAGCSPTIDASTASFADPGAWHHIVYTNDTSGHKVYVDGGLPPITYSTGSASIDFFFDNITGIREYWVGTLPTSEQFGGILDDIRIYDRVLTASEIYQLYTAGTATVNAPLDDPLSQSLRGYWKLDEGTGTNATDSSGNGNTLAFTGSPSWTTPAKIGPYMLDFSGTGQYLSVADPASGVLDFVNGASFSLTGWFNRDTFAADHTIIAKKNDQSTSGEAGYIVWVDNGTPDTLCLAVYGTAGYTVCSTSDLGSSGWHHFVIAWDDAVGVKIYIDGADNTGTPTGTFSSVASLANARAFTIGAESDATAGTLFDGKLDDIRVYGYPLSSGEIQKLYQTTAPAQPVDTGLVGHWTFDGPDIKGMTVIDRSGKGNNGTLTGTTKTIGKLGQGLSFNGSDYVEAAFSGISGYPFTLATWVNPPNLTIDTAEIDVFVGIDNDHYFAVGITDPSVTGFVLPGIIGRNTSFNEFSGSTPIPINSWSFLVGVFKSATERELYVNGQYDGEDTGSISQIANMNRAILGSGDGILYSDHKVDDARIYNRALSATEIANLYNVGK